MLRNIEVTYRLKQELLSACTDSSARRSRFESRWVASWPHPKEHDNESGAPYPELLSANSGRNRTQMDELHPAPPRYPGLGSYSCRTPGFVLWGKNEYDDAWNKR